MGRRKFTPEFKLEAVKLVRERGVTVRQAAADLGLHENVLRKWVKDARVRSAVGCARSSCISGPSPVDAGCPGR